MPGIVGLITSMPRERAERELLQMVGALNHEDFYVTGTWVEESLGVYVGWIARKGSFSDRMPLRNEQGDVVHFAGAFCRRRNLFARSSRHKRRAIPPPRYPSHRNPRDSEHQPFGEALVPRVREASK